MSFIISKSHSSASIPSTPIFMKFMLLLLITNEIAVGYRLLLLPGDKNQFQKKKKKMLTLSDSFAPSEYFDNSYLFSVWLFAVFLTPSRQILRLNFD
jgi:hypothetical protein